MVLVDTSIWIDHFRIGNALLENLLHDQQVNIHPFIIGELALGHMKQRKKILSLLHDLPQTLLAKDDEVLHFIDQTLLFGSGIGYIDAHLLVSAKLSFAKLWSRDLRLHGIAIKLGIAFFQEHHTT